MGSGMAVNLARVGGLSGIAIGIAYVAITGMYVIGGQVPPGVDGAEWLAYFADRIPAWWGIIGLSVVTDALYVPVAVALVIVLRADRRNAVALWGGALLVLFVVLDLAITWPTFGALMRLAQDEGRATEAAAAAATYAAAVLDSTLFAVYAILVPSLGVLLLSVAMLWQFSRAAGWIGIATGILGSVAVVGGTIVEPIGTLVIPASILTAVWFVVVGYRLLRPIEPS